MHWRNWSGKWNILDIQLKMIMIECIFTIDYEIYGNGQGSLRELVYEPAEKLKEMFLKWQVRFVNFVEVAELDRIEEQGIDTTVARVKEQIHELHRNGFEIGLHLHPQWYNAQYREGIWRLDYAEYSLCLLPRKRIEEIIDRALNFLRRVVNESTFIPCSFRAGNWLFQPSQTLAEILSKRGIKIDSSMFKGGYQHKHNLDYRSAIKNGHFWKFSSDINTTDPQGKLLEIPTFTKMVFPWQMLTHKRVRLQQKANATNSSSIISEVCRLKDFLRIKQPLKLDFCRMTIQELTKMIEHTVNEDTKYPETFKPIVAIGHTKDLYDFVTIEQFLRYLKIKKIKISTLQEVYNKCQ